MKNNNIDFDRLDDETVLSWILYCAEHKVPKETFDSVIRMFVDYMEINHPEDLNEIIKRANAPAGQTDEDIYRKYLDLMDSKP